MRKGLVALLSLQLFLGSLSYFFLQFMEPEFAAHHLPDYFQAITSTVFGVCSVLSPLFLN